MGQYIDLHTHSVYSEGVLTCQQLLKSASKNQIAVLSLTDHNVIDGSLEISELSKKYDITVISGVEIYTRYKNRGLHLLGYNFRLGNTPLNQSLKERQQDHLKKVKQSMTSLIKLGFTLDAERIFNCPSLYLGIVHILKELEKYPENQKKMEKELAPQENNYFGKVFHYFGQGQPAYLPQSELPTEKAIDIIKKSGGLAVLAHPGQQLSFEGDNIIYDLIKKGLDGLEVASPYHNWHQIEHYQKLSLKNNLLITGGSDYHTDIGFSKKEPIKRQWDYFKVPYIIYENLKKYL